MLAGCGAMPLPDATPGYPPTSGPSALLLSHGIKDICDPRGILIHPGTTVLGLHLEDWVPIPAGTMVSIKYDFGAGDGGAPVQTTRYAKFQGAFVPEEGKHYMANYGEHDGTMHYGVSEVVGMKKFGLGHSTQVGKFIQFTPGEWASCAGHEVTGPATSQ
jgi:hypothetical protein